jgi:hypothetical protein
MANDKGQPSGTNKPKSGTGIPTNISSDKMQKDNELTEKYTDDDNDIADNVHTGHPNRNVDKGDATNSGGYRN